MVKIGLSGQLGLWMLIGVAVVATAGLVAVCCGLDTGPLDSGILVGVLVAMLVFDVPVCALLLWEWVWTRKMPELSLGQLLWPLFPLSDQYDEWKFYRRLAQREDLEAEEFVRRYYAGTEVPAHVVLRILPIYSRSLDLPMRKLRPHDWPPQIAELDMAPLVREIETEFGIAPAQWNNVDGSFDSVVRYMAERVKEMDSLQRDDDR